MLQGCNEHAEKERAGLQGFGATAYRAYMSSGGLVAYIWQIDLFLTAVNILICVLITMFSEIRGSMLFAFILLGLVLAQTEF